MFVVLSGRSKDNSRSPLTVPGTLTPCKQALITSLIAIFQSSSCIMNEADPLYSSFIVNSVVNAFSAYTATMLNILAIHAIRKTSSLPKPLKTLLLSLAVSDLGVGLLAQPLYISSMIHPTYSTVIAFEIIATLFTYASFSLVVAIGVDRFLAIHLHLRYQELVTHKRVVAVVISIWTLSLLFPLLISYLKLRKPVLVVINAILGFCQFHYYRNYLFQNVFHCTPSRKPNPSPSNTSRSK